MNQARPTLIATMLATALLAGAAFAETHDARGDRTLRASTWGLSSTVFPVQTVAFVNSFKVPDLRHRSARIPGRSNTFGSVLVRVDPKISTVDPFRFNR